jgi:hypothetical protein
VKVTRQFLLHPWLTMSPWRWSRQTAIVAVVVVVVVVVVVIASTRT